MALGQLVVSLGLDAAEFITGMSKSEAQAQRFSQTIDRSVATGIIKAQIAIEALTRGAAMAADAFKVLTTGAAEFKDLEETTGASAENIASFAVSAATAGVQVESVAGSMNKLTKNLVGVDDEGKAAGAALKALGLDVEKFKQLDPAAQYEAIGKALNGFADGAQKSAVAQALFGKTGAEQLKVFKALEEAGGRQIILTQRQIELADAYADRQAKSAATLRLYAQAAVSEALPALNDLTKAATDVIKALLAVDEAGKGISANNAVQEFAEGAADSLAFLADAGVATVRVIQAIAGSFKSVGADTLFLAQALAFKSAPTLDNLRDLKEAFDARNRIAAESNQNYLDLLNKDAAAFRKSLSSTRDARKAEEAARRAEDRGFTPSGFNKPTLNFDGAQKTDKIGKDVLSDAEKYLRNLESQQEATQQLTVYEKFLADVRTGKLGVSPLSAQYATLSLKAQEVDADKELIRLARERADAKNKDYQAGNDAAAANAIADQARLTQLLSGTEQALFDSRQSNLIVLQNALEAGKIGADQYADAVRKLFGVIDEDARDATRLINELDMSFQSAFEDAIVSGKKFGEVLRGLEQDLIRIALRKLVIEPAANSVVGGLRSFFTPSAGGGSSLPFDPGLNDGTHAAGLSYVPWDGYRATLHKGERVMTRAENAMAPRDRRVVINNYGAKIEERTNSDGDLELIVQAAVSEVDRRIASGGSTARALRARGLRLDGNLPNRTR